MVNNFDGTFDYTPAPGFIGVVEFIYEICYEECPDYCDQAIVKIRIDLRDDSCKPNNLITPNNDARNDVVVIDCLKSGKYPNNGLKIYNQWGDWSANPHHIITTGLAITSVTLLIPSRMAPITMCLPGVMGQMQSLDLSPYFDNAEDHEDKEPAFDRVAWPGCQHTPCATGEPLYTVHV
ncbi:MAG: gliding motility-associated C-terminal domain-containing protein [Saprospiraceae bacterium]|nr:gliding motility-associated C-terminal domain-containing protein [Saprospiraceae bacterium]